MPRPARPPQRSAKRPPGTHPPGHHAPGHHAPDGGRRRSHEFAAEPPPRERLFRVAGLPAVEALFAHAPDRVERLFFEASLRAEVAGFCQRLATARRPYRMVDADELARVAGTVLHGGVVALIEPRPVPALDLDLALGWARDGQPLLVLDGVGNPHNLGAIVRTAAFFGLPRLVVSDHPGQALPSEAAHRVAAGGFEWLGLYKAAGLPTVLKRLSGAYRIVGTALGAPGRTIADPAQLAQGPKPVLLVMGNEEDGLPPATLAACDAVLTLPGSGRVQSLNVAATAAILIHALSRR